MESKTAKDRLIHDYNKYSRRPTTADLRARHTIFKSLERQLRSWLPVDPAASILDVACGEGSLLLFLRENGYTNLAGFDLSPECVTICHKLGLDFVEIFDATQVHKFGDSSQYETIFALDIIEHLALDEVLIFIENSRERLRNGGYIVLRTPNMGSILGGYIRHSDLTHEFGLTEVSAVSLLMLAGFEPASIEVVPAWNATRPLGYVRELWLRALHALIFISEGSSRPKIPTKNLLIRAANQ